MELTTGTSTIVQDQESLASIGIAIIASSRPELAAHRSDQENSKRCKDDKYVQPCAPSQTQFAAV